MAVPFALPSEDEAEAQGQQLEQLMIELYAALQQVLRSRAAQHPSRNHRVPRRSSELPGSREHPVILIDSDLSRLPLPDLVLSAVEQLPAAVPQVTVSAPSSPTRDAAFQFPECSGTAPEVPLNGAFPVPSPRPRPRRRRLASESSAPEKGPVPESCNGPACRGQFSQTLDGAQWASVGANLRNIADDFHASKTKDAELEKSRLPLVASGLSGAGGNGATSGTDSILSLLIPAPLRETLWTTVALYLGWRLVSRLR